MERESARGRRYHLTLSSSLPITPSLQSLARGPAVHSIPTPATSHLSPSSSTPPPAMRFPRVPKHIFPSGRRPSAPNHAHPPLPGSPPPGVPITPLSCNSNQLPPPSYDIAIAESPIASSSTSPPLPPSSISLSRDDKNLNNLGLASTPDTAVLALDVVPVLTNTEPPSENMLVLLREDYQSVRSVIAKLTWRQCCRNLIAKWLWSE